MGLGYVTDMGKQRVQFEAGIVAYQTRMSGLTETNATSAYDAMTISGHSRSGNAMVLSSTLSGAINERANYTFGAKLVSFGGEQKNAATARLNTEEIAFTVNARGLSNTQLNVSAGLNYRLSSKDSVGATLSGSGWGNHQTRVQYARSF